ncbi:helix-turn-helix domain-containing protein [Bdellovibrio sp. HCB209]|uniref:helix-turn-helix domain-containing protein n=1 Tax=Bdellovibrio sp. HCB209 TaxID=3394354 RepID=UPI0039B6D1B5
MGKAITLGDFLKSAREAAGLSQGDVSTKLGYSTPQFISNWERNVSNPPIDTLKKIGNMYKVDPEELFEVVLKAAIHETTEDLKRKFKQSR